LPRPGRALDFPSVFRNIPEVAMKRIALFAAASAVSALSAALLLAQDSKPADGWVKVFDGKSIADWKIGYAKGVDESSSKWEVKDGIIVSSGKVSHLFTPRGDYENFEVKAEISVNQGGNSGFYFRTAFGPGFPAGYEAQVNATHGDPVKTGSIYNHVKIFKQLHKQDEWFTYHLKVQGNRIWVTVNGELLYEYVDQKNSYTKGHFAFQQHHIGSEVRIKSLEVKELPPSKR
jgi:hypothetical protein